jgi:putative endonuclease
LGSSGASNAPRIPLLRLRHAKLLTASSLHRHDHNLHKRVWEHKNHSFEGFTDDYNATRLVYWESSDDVHKAIGPEKQLKGWRREKKMRLVETTNPRWQDLAAGWYETQGPSTAAPVHFVSERPRSG